MVVHRAPAELTFAGKVLDALKADSAVVPATWGLEVANVIARAEASGLVTEARSGEFLELLDGVRIDLPLATLDEDLQKAAKKAGVKKLR